MSMLKAFAWVAIIEAASWLVLIAASFFKRGTDVSWGDAAVTLIGPIHGFLSVAFVALLLLNHFQRKWSIRKTLIDFVAVIIPGFGFWVGKWALEEDRASISSSTKTA